MVLQGRNLHLKRKRFAIALGRVNESIEQEIFRVLQERRGSSGPRETLSRLPIMPTKLELEILGKERQTLSLVGGLSLAATL